MDKKLPNAVLCVGMLNCDVYFKDIPRNLMQMDTTWAGGVDMRVGGDAANVATDLSLMGLKVNLCANVTNDVFGDYTCEMLEKAGVDTSFVYHNSTSGSATSLLFFDPEGQKHSASFWGGNRTLEPSQVTDEMLDTARHMHVGSFVNLQRFFGDSAIDLLKRAKAKGLTISADISAGGGKPIEWDKITPMMPYCDMFTMNENEMFTLTGTRDEKEAAEKLRPFAPGLLILKQGPRGVYVTDYKEVAKLYPTLTRPEEVKDTTGAGDSFNSGFIAAMLKGLSLDECIHVGSMCSALCLNNRGASTWGIPFDDVLALARQRAAAL